MELHEQIDRLNVTVEHFATAVRTLDERSFLAKFGNWSVRDIVAHLVGWNRHVIEGSQQIQRGELPFYDIDAGEDYSKVNAELLRIYDSTDRETLLAQLDGTARELAEFLESLDLEAWAHDFGVRHGDARVTIRETVEELIGDYDHHRKQIESWADSI